MHEKWACVPGAGGRPAPGLHDSRSTTLRRDVTSRLSGIIRHWREASVAEQLPCPMLSAILRSRRVHNPTSRAVRVDFRVVTAPQRPLGPAVPALRNPSWRCGPPSCPASSCNPAQAASGRRIYWDGTCERRGRRAMPRLPVDGRRSGSCGVVRADGSTSSSCRLPRVPSA